MIKHRETHPGLDVDGCFGCRIASVRIAAAAMPTRHEAVNNLDSAWNQQMRDDEAYKRLRRNGLHPESTQHCAVLEQVDDVRFIEPRPTLWDERADILESTDTLPQVKVS